MESSNTVEKSPREGENSPKSCLINMLNNDISGKVVINDDSEMNNMNDVQKIPAEGHYIEKYKDDKEAEDDEEEGDDFDEEEMLALMGYGKSEPERLINKEHQKQCYDDDNEDDEEDDDLLNKKLAAQIGYPEKEPPKYEPFVTPTAALNLVSALKGSREKEGKQARECRVSWAPDVYDPSPISAEDFTTTNDERHKSKHKVKGLHGKNKQKMGRKGAGGLEGEGGGSKGSKDGGNKGSVGGGGKAGVKYKDKKQVKKKHGGSASK